MAEKTVPKNKMLPKPANKTRAVTPPPQLVTAKDLSDWSGGKISVSDPRLTDLIAGATAAVRRFCGWHIAPVLTETVLIDGPGGHHVQLPTLRLVAVDEIKDLGTVVEDYDWSASGMLRLRHGRFTNRYRGVEATFTHGFESAPDVAQIIKQVCAAALSSPMGVTREQAGQMSLSWATTAPGVSGGLSLLQRDLDILTQYRLGRVS